MARYQVIVGNVGLVYSGDDPVDAKDAYNEYKEMSVSGYGRAAYEDVTLMRNGEPELEHVGESDLTKYSVLVKPRIMVRIDGVLAQNQREAAKKAIELWEEHGRDLDNVMIQLRIPGLRYVDFAEDEDIFEVMVDVEGDDTYAETGWYLVAMSEPEAIVDDTNWMNRKFHDLIVEEAKKQEEES